MLNPNSIRIAFKMPMKKNNHKAGFFFSNVNFNQYLYQGLQQYDPKVFDLSLQQLQRSQQGINLIAPQNYSSQAVIQTVGSIMNSKYSEGLPGVRYYAGAQWVDQSQNLCMQRALQLYNLDSKVWGINVQALSGSTANFCVYNGIMAPHERILSLDLPAGGHLSHGYQSQNMQVSSPSIFFEVASYGLDPITVNFTSDSQKTELIDYDKMEELAKIYSPNLIIAGASSYPRNIDYERIRKICDQNNSYMMVDMAFSAGEVAVGLSQSPFHYADIVTTTTHKSLRGPRGALVFFKKQINQHDNRGKEIQVDMETRINNSIFPGLQGGPHNHTIAAIAVCLGESSQQQFKTYQEQVLKNCQKLGELLSSRGYRLLTGGTDTNMLILDLQNNGIQGMKAEQILEAANIYTNRNVIPGDQGPSSASGLRLGTLAMTSRGLTEGDFNQVVQFIDRGLKIVPKIKSQLTKPTNQAFIEYLEKNSKEIEDLNQLQTEVTQFSSQWGVPGY